MKKIFQHSLFAFVVAAQLGIADDTWKGLTSTKMSDGTNWVSGSVPPSPAGNLTFPAGGVTNFSVLADDPTVPGVLAVSNLTVDSSTTGYSFTAASGNSFSFSSGNTFTNTGSTSFAIPIAITGSYSIASSSGDLTLGSAISGPPGTTVTITSGSVIFGVGNAYGAALGVTTINANTTTPATLKVLSGAALPTNVVNNGTLIFAPTGIDAYNFSISGSGAVQVAGTSAGNITFGAQNSYSGVTTLTSGTLSIADGNRLGDGSSTNTLALGAGTLSISANKTITQAINLTDAGTIDTANNDVVLNGKLTGVQGGSLTITAGSGSLRLNSDNTYSGGTTLKSGILLVSHQNSLGSGSLTMGGTPTTTLSIQAPMTLPNGINLQGPSTFKLNNHAVTLAAPVTGSGHLTIAAGNSTLTLSSKGGASSYTGGTTISSGTVVGDTSSIQGDFALNKGNLIFKQSTDGTYSGTLTSVGKLHKQGSGIATFSGDSKEFKGSTAITGGTLFVTGALSSSGTNLPVIAVSAGGALAGSGTVGSVRVADGFIGPNNVKKLTVKEDLTLNSASTYRVKVKSTAHSSDQVDVLGTATLNKAAVFVDPEPGFYGFGSTYTILKSGSRIGNFSKATTKSSNFRFTLANEGNDVLLKLAVIEPFLDFPADNKNIKSVANNLDELALSGALAGNPALSEAVNSLAGESFAEVNEALDQLHPAPFSAFSELQVESGSKLLSLFHRRPGPACCEKTWRLWLEPYGNWLTEKQTGMQQGFHSQTGGGALGMDWQLHRNLVFGLGGAGNYSRLDWNNHRGHSDINGYYGAAYTDFTYNYFYLGASVLGGVDRYRTHRHINFSTIDETARAKHSAVDIMGQLSTGLFLGPSSCLFFPFINVDYFFLGQDSFTERGAPGLNLSVKSFDTQTVRAELGAGLQVQDKNYKETMCISPKVSLGWAMQRPVSHESIKASFEGENLKFAVDGWDYTWQLFTFNLGLNFSYKCFTIGAEYIGEINGNDKFFGQTAHLQLLWKW